MREITASQRAASEDGEPLFTDTRTVQRLGNSLFISFHVSINEMWDLQKGDEVEVEVREDSYTVRRIERSAAAGGD